MPPVRNARPGTPEYEEEVLNSVHRPRPVSLEDWLPEPGWVTCLLHWITLEEKLEPIPSQAPHLLLLHLPCVSLPSKYLTWVVTPAFASLSCLALDAHAKLEVRVTIAGPGLSWEWSKEGEQSQEVVRVT